MRALILFITLLSTTSLFALPCKQYDKVAEYLNTKKFIAASREHRALKKEPQLNLGDSNQARSVAYRLPAFEELGFGKPGSAGWSSYKGRMEKSSLNGKKIGWEVKNDKGHARVRLDWDPEKGGHYNIEITQSVNGKKETHKLAVGFLCGNVKCSEAQIIKMAEKLQ
jgi:hypothetical protein